LLQFSKVFLTLLNMAMLEAGVFSRPVNHKFSTRDTKLSFCTSMKLLLQVCQSTVRVSPV